MTSGAGVREGAREGRVGGWGRGKIRVRLATVRQLFSHMFPTTTVPLVLSS